MLASAKEMVKEEGAGYLLAGLGPTVVGYGVEGAMKFGVYEGEKKPHPTLLAGGATPFLRPIRFNSSLRSSYFAPRSPQAHQSEDNRQQSRRVPRRFRRSRCRRRRPPLPHGVDPHPSRLRP